MLIQSFHFVILIVRHNYGNLQHVLLSRALCVINLLGTTITLQVLTGKTLQNQYSDAVGFAEGRPLCNRAYINEECKLP